MSLDLDKASLTVPQQHALAAAFSGEYRWIVWLGGIRSGKSVGAGLIISLLAMESRQQCAVAATTQTAARRIFTPIFRDIAEWYGVSFRETREGYLVDGVLILVLASSDRDSLKAIQGATLRAAWIDEAVYSDELFAITLQQRCSGADGLTILTLNGAQPGSWVQQWFYTDTEVPRTYKLESFITDNHHLPQETVDFYLSMPYPQFVVDRVFLNKFVAEHPLVVDLRPEHDTEPPDKVWQYIVGLDPGAAGITGAVLLGQTLDQRCYVLDEYYWDSAKMGRQADRQHIASILELWSEAKDAVWVVDSAATNAILEGDEMGLMVEQSMKGRAVGFRNIQQRLSKGHLWLCGELPNLRREATMLEWNPVSDEPKNGAHDHLLDALSYAMMYALPPEEWI